LEGLGGLIHAEYISITECDTLTSLNGLQNLQKIEGSLSLRHNQELASIDSIYNIDVSTLNFLSIHSNPNLAICNIDPICTYLDENIGPFNIYSNDIGCNGATEVEYDCQGLLSIFQNTASGFASNPSFFWNQASNWRNNQVPTEDCLVIIPPNINCIVPTNYDAECQILDVREGGSIDVKNSATLTVTGQ